MLSSLIVEPRDICVKIARQSGKTEVLTLVLRFLILFQLHLVDRPLMAAIASLILIDACFGQIQRCRREITVEPRVAATRTDSQFPTACRVKSEAERKVVKLWRPRERHRSGDGGNWIAAEFSPG